MLVSNFTYDHGAFGSSLIDIVGYYWNLSKESLNLVILFRHCVSKFLAPFVPKVPRAFFD